MLHFASTLAGFEKFCLAQSYQYCTIPDTSLITIYVKYLLQKPISCLPTFQHVDKYGRTPLFVAAMSGKVEVVNSLIEHGANVNVSSSYNILYLGHIWIEIDYSVIVVLMYGTYVAVDYSV